MGKPNVRRIPSDGCGVADETGGATYYPHEGEWVDVIPGMEVRMLAVLQKFNGLADAYAAIEGDSDADEKAIALSRDAIETALPALRDRVVGWSWTDDLGRPLPQPLEDPDVFLRLKGPEVGWLVAAVQGRIGGDLPNAGSGTPTTSSATAQPQTRRQPATGRNRTRQ